MTTKTEASARRGQDGRDLEISFRWWWWASARGWTVVVVPVVLAVLAVLFAAAAVAHAEATQHATSAHHARQDLVPGSGIGDRELITTPSAAVRTLVATPATARDC
ncbi:hypothetical protein [Nocardia macrotermitis]|uniref:Uncharacterized protein n=1 Tax=Nocardia macrotermitis TaxID=2585198 RepID=A0A7K0DB39_9NOCA|nr:hypothetical protein [Nocardia macrotermitis]MQY23006.1 hypothetical protein [Nocardia macrotermitis]